MKPDAPDERILGALTIEAADLQCAGEEATAETRLYEALQWGGLALAVVGTVLNLRDASSAHSHWLPYLIIPVVIFGIISGRQQRAQRAQAVRKRITESGSGEAAVIQYELGPSRFDRQSGSKSVRCAWSTCQGFDEERNTFLLYFDRAVPDVLFKRAFRAEDLSRVRALLDSCIEARQPVGKRAKLRAVMLALVLGFAVLGLGVFAAMFLR